MQTTGEMVKALKQHGTLIIEDHRRHMIDDLTFTLKCLCLPFVQREVESTKLGRVVKIKLTNMPQ